MFKKKDIIPLVFSLAIMLSLYFYPPAIIFIVLAAIIIFIINLKVPSLTPNMSKKDEKFNDKEIRDNSSSDSNNIERLLSLDKFYVTFIKTDGEEEKVFEYLIPSITFDGKIWVYTKEEYAKSSVERNGADIFYYKEFSRLDFLYLFRRKVETKIN